MKILIVTGIYPPDIGGPAQYAKNLAEIWRKDGKKVKVLSYKIEKWLPIGIRHTLFFFRTLFSLKDVDFVFGLDTFSTAWPALCAVKVWGKKMIIRTGGDFLWEGYVERTGDLILLKYFYSLSREKWNIKEKIIFKFIKWILCNVDILIFSTAWQRDIFVPAYQIDITKTRIVENYYGEKLFSYEPKEKNFIAGGRSLKGKNSDRVKMAFEKAKVINSQLIYDFTTTSHNRFIEKVQNSYAVILASLSDISPNTILDAIRCNKPFILTMECGLYDKLKDIAVFVDPENIDDITQKIIWLSDNKNYEEQKKKIETFNFTHSWEEIGREIIKIYEQS
ncbi:MAG: glycosyltransferase [Patescibacteria group bacterium]|nr:glycosyltransferase [Patescibacteria group bacterium]